MTRLLLLGISALALFAAASGCDGGPDDTRWPEVLELKERDITPVLLQNQLQVGDTRFSVGLQDRDDQLILRAGVTFRFFTIEGEEGTLKAETPAKYAGFDTNFVHEHEDGTQHTHTGPEVGVYAANVTFEKAGDWGVEVVATVEGRQYDALRLRFSVLEEGTVPAIGDVAPRTRQVALRDVADISEIDSTNPPNPGMHDLTVAEALDTGKPVVVAFATPAFCTSRTCGPVMDKVVVPLFQRYRDRVVFVHIEPYDLTKARSGEGLAPVPAMAEWRLDTEPWVFVIDRQGRIAAKFEGIMGVDEVEEVLARVLQ